MFSYFSPCYKKRIPYFSLVAFDRIVLSKVNVCDSGSAARFFYCAKASKADRDEGLDAFEEARCGHMEDDGYDIRMGNGVPRDTRRRNIHPTVKPVALMRYLVRLITPPNGLCLDPFLGSGSTGKAAMLEGFRFVGIEREAEYFAIAEARIRHAAAAREREESEPMQAALL